MKKLLSLSILTIFLAGSALADQPASRYYGVNEYSTGHCNGRVRVQPQAQTLTQNPASRAQTSLSTSPIRSVRWQAPANGGFQVSPYYYGYDYGYSPYYGYHPNPRGVGVHTIPFRNR